MTFKIGDQVIHPQHGVGQVIKLESREFEPGVIQHYYEVSIPAAGSTLWVPSDQPTTGLRKLAERKEVEQCRRILVSPPVQFNDDPRTRQSNLASRLKEGTIFTQCEIVRDLYGFGEHKSLYGTMANFFRQTQNVLCEEWALVEEITLSEAIEEVNSLLEKSRKAVSKSKT